MKPTIIQGSASSDYSNSRSRPYFEVGHNNNSKPMLPYPQSRKREHDENISGREALLMRRKLPKTTTTFVQPSSSLKIAWSKKAEISILSGILEFQKETESSYRQNWDDFYGYMSVTMGSDFSKQQLMDKVNKLKKRFRDNQARDNDGIRLSFTNTDDEELFRLSKAIWVYEENKDQTKCIVLKEDVPCAEHEQRVVRNANTEVNNGEEEDGVGDLCVIKDALEAAASYQSLSEDLRKFLLGNLKNVGANQRKELTDGWTALLAKDTELDIKKRTFFAKLVNMGFVSAP